jgi:NAD(P)-dependent dehydrogenase (short-subunit alcohol dehydrogenase family)
MQAPQRQQHRHRASAMLPHIEFLPQNLANQFVPLKRFGVPDEVSGLIALPASDRASFIIGSGFNVEV